MVPHIEASTVPGPLLTVLARAGVPNSVRSSSMSIPLAPLLMFTQATTRPEDSGTPECAGVAWNIRVPGALLTPTLAAGPLAVPAPMIVVTRPLTPQPKVGAG